MCKSITYCCKPIQHTHTEYSAVYATYYYGVQYSVLVLLPAYTFCFASPNQGEAGYRHALTLTLPKHLHTQNTNLICWCPHKHDTYVKCLSHTARVTVTVWHCDRACMPMCNLCTRVTWERGGGVAFLVFWWVWLRGRVYAASLWQRWSGSILQVSWGLIVSLKYSWAHWVDKWRYKHTVKFSIGQVSLTSPDTIYCMIRHSL